MVSSIIKESTDKPYIAMQPYVQSATDSLREFLFEHVYRNPVAKSEESKAQEMLIRLFEHFVKNYDKMPKMYKNNIEEDGVERCACDFISGMTDRYAIEVYSDLYIPKVWRGPRE
jgi:dGTPase